MTVQKQVKFDSRRMMSMKRSASAKRNNLICCSVKMETKHCSQCSVNLHQTAVRCTAENSKLICKEVKFFIFLLRQFSLHLLYRLFFFFFFLPHPSLFCILLLDTATRGVNLDKHVFTFIVGFRRLCLLN